MTFVSKNDARAVSSSAPKELWYTRCPVPTTSGIAQHFKWLHDTFAERGIGLESIRASADPAVRESHFNHSLAGMFREGGNVPPIWARAKGQQTVVVGITWIDEEQVILVRPDSDIYDLKDLRNRRLGIPKHGTKHVDVGRAQDLRGVITALALAGLKKDDVQIVDILVQGEFDLKENSQRTGLKHATAEALLAGTVDAIYAKGAVSATLAAHHGLRAIVDINANPDPLVRVNAGTPRPITIDRDLALHHPDLVATYLAVLLRTAEWAKTHPKEVIDAITAETGTTREAVRQGYGPELHLRFTPSLSDQYVVGLEAQKNFLLEWGFLPGDFDFKSWIVREPLELAASIAPKITAVPR